MPNTCDKCGKPYDYKVSIKADGTCWHDGKQPKDKNVGHYIHSTSKHGG